ncbi:MAG: flagellar biosynthesis protein FlhF [Pseudohongiellaceae bacterium]|jgi:flagellar biosynthesis protein FlhF
MKVKRFLSTSMQDVLRMVREDLGPDAVILSNTKVDGGIELVAALDYEEEAIPHDGNLPNLMSQGEPSPSQLARMHADKHVKLQREMDTARRNIENVKSKRSSNNKSRHSVSENESVAQKVNQQEGGLSREGKAERKDSDWVELSDMRAEILEIKGMISRQPADSESIKNSRVSSLLQQQVEKTLQSLCLSLPIQKSLIESVKGQLDFESAWEKVGRQIEGAVTVDRAEIIDQGGVVALVGPTGSGKTMTIGKMAARYVMKYGAESIALVTTDRYRIAAHEQLKVFGRILNVPVHVVDEANTLDAILESVSHKKLVLIDTAGLMHSDACWLEQLQEMKMSKHAIKSYLVVSAVGQYQVMCSNYHNYKVVGLSGAIITKIDEAVSLGEALSFLIDTRLKASYFTDGQRVPEDIHLMKKQDLFERAQALLNSSERWVTINSNETGQTQDSFLFHTA